MNGEKPPFGRPPHGRPDWFRSSPYRMMREADYSNMSPGMRKFQKTLWWIVGIGTIAALVTFVTLLIILR
jgi:hypothetical protein